MIRKLHGSHRARGGFPTLRNCTKAARKESRGSSWIGSSTWHRRRTSQRPSEPGRSRTRVWKKSFSCKPASNQAIALVNSVARFLAPGTTQHHGSLISEFLSCRQGDNESGADSGVRIDLLPANLDFTDLPSAAFVENVARVFGDVWLAGLRGENGDLARALFRRRIQATLDEFASLGMADVGRVGFDCVAVSVDVRRVCRFDGLL
jgi:hypothetical protein